MPPSFPGRTLGALLLCGASILAFALSLRTSRPLLLNLGAGDAPFVQGFRAGWERDGLTGAGETMFRWTEDGARLTLPVEVVGGDLRARLRLARFSGTSVEMTVVSAGRVAGRWVQPPRGWRVHELDLGPLRGPVVLEFASHSEDGAPLGIALDWVELHGARGLRPARRLLGGMLCLLLGLPLLAWLASRRATVGLVSAAIVFAAAALLVWGDPLGGLVALSAAGVPCLLVAAALLAAVHWLSRVWPEQVDGAAAVVAVAATAVSLLALFHPFYFYPDVDTHSRLSRALEANPWLLVDATQPWERRGDLVREIGGRRIAIPYSMVFHAAAWPLTPLLGAVPALKTLAVLCLGLSLVLVYALGRGLGLAPWGARTAQALFALLPVTASRLTLALYPTLLGQALNLALLVHLLRRFPRLDGARDAAAAAAFFAAAQAAYTGSLPMVGLFTATYLLLEAALGDRRRALRLLGAYAVATTVVVVVMYGGFFSVLWRDVWPHLGPGSASTPRPGAAEALRLGAARAGLFFDLVYPVLLVPGLLALRSSPRHVRRLLAATLLAGGAVFVLRYLLPTLLRDAKEVELLAGPVAALAAAGAALLWSRGGAWRGGAVAAVLAAAGWGLARSAALYAERFVAMGR